MILSFLLSFFHDLASGNAPLPRRLFIFGCLVLLSLIFAFLCNLLIRSRIRSRNPNIGKYTVGISVKYPLFWCISLTGIYYSLGIFSFSPGIAIFVNRVYFILMVLCISCGLLRCVRSFSTVFRETAQTTGNVYHVLLINLIEPTLKTIIWLCGILFVLDNVFHFKIGTLLAGAGIVSMAVAFAAQNTIANVFGAISLMIERPFLPGDWIQVADKSGTVQTVGLKSVRLLSADGTIWFIPNKVIAESSVLNVSRRPFFRYTFVLNLTYSHTPEQMQRGKELLKEILAKQPLVDKTAHQSRITFENFGTSSLDLQVICWIQTANAAEFSKVKDEINFAILKTFNENGFDFAFPTQSIYIEKMPGKSV